MNVGVQPDGANVPRPIRDKQIMRQQLEQRFRQDSTRRENNAWYGSVKSPSRFVVTAESGRVPVICCARQGLIVATERIGMDEQGNDRNPGLQSLLGDVGPKRPLHGPPAIGELRDAVLRTAMPGDDEGNETRAKLRPKMKAAAAIGRRRTYRLASRRRCINCRGRTEVFSTGSDASVCATPWPRSGGCARG
jgi:hypothetical protein